MTQSLSSPTFADHVVSPMIQPLLPSLTQILAFAPRRRVSGCRSDARSILSVTEGDCSVGSSSLSIHDASTEICQPLPTGFPASPSKFELRCESTEDYLVERLEQHLQRLSLDDAVCALPPVTASSDAISMDICLESQSQDVSLPRNPILLTLPAPQPSILLSATLLPRDTPRSTFSGDDGPSVPMIVITSVDAKHARPFQPSAQRSSRTPFGSSNFANLTTADIPPYKPPTAFDDPFISPCVPSPTTLTFRLPPFPSTYPHPAWCSTPETPTPTVCEHFGECSEDLWDILHPPLVARPFTLPPFALPPLHPGLFEEMTALSAQVRRY
ncbi:hypothetical protein HYDPIDRAFT_110270 [Hydnomerulius pinastri MD-312]|nr:hypothetical protein HYDPIDRAFT_110270 [Hydnomerulius pinastri MD-312]